MPLLTNKFFYTPLFRKEHNGARFYQTPDGAWLPSVTTILAATQSAEKKAVLENWRARVGQQKAITVSQEAASRGTRMHKFLENYVISGQLQEPGSNPFSKHGHKMALEIIKHGLRNITEVWGSEIGLYYPDLYAGTCDGCGVYLDDEVVFDYKQSNRIKLREHIEDYFLQLLLYATAHNKLYGTNIKKGVIFMSVLPPIDSNARAEPIFREFILQGNEWQAYESKMWDRVEKFYSAQVRNHKIFSFVDDSLESSLQC